MSTIKENVQQLNSMILEGKILDAFEQFYGDEVVMRDNDGPAREGKHSCREFEQDFVNSLTAFRGAEVKNVMVSEDAGVATVEWGFDYTHKDWGDRNYTQVAVQRWKDGKIISEQFLYQN
jgi:hypothetical protein